MKSSRHRDVLLLAAVFVTAAGCAVWLHWPALAEYGVYPTDVRQSPHWAAYHTTSFRPDDLILEYARYNESPLQNAVYWVGTWFADSIRLGKCLSVVGYGLAACLFFFAGRNMYNTRTGLLMALFFTFLPNHFEYSAGFFSKVWSMPLLLLGLWILRSEKWPWLAALMPFAALAYPVTPVLLGMICGVHMLLLGFEDRARALSLFRWLCAGSVLALGALGMKYVSPPELIGPMLSQADLLAILKERNSRFLRFPSLWEELRGRLGHPFFLASAVGFLAVLGRRRFCWERSWTALVVASAAGYALADLLFIRLYIPNRYTRYSLAVLLVLWSATNWDRVLERIPRARWRAAAVVGLTAVALVAFGDTFEQGAHSTRATPHVPLCAFVRTLPEGVLVAGPTRYLDDIMIQSRRSVLSAFKLDHPWFSRYSAELHERTLAIYAALYAADAASVDRLRERYGVTHLVYHRSYLGSRLRSGRFDSRYDREIRERIVGERDNFFLRRPPAGAVVYDSGGFVVLELPVSGR